MAESQREAINLALNSTKLNATNSLFREDPSLVFSIVREARDQTPPGSLLARETLGTRLGLKVPFPSLWLPPLQSKSKCEVFMMVIACTSHMKANFHKKNFPLRLALKGRQT